MSHNAVVLGGGGAKGSYEVGVWKALREMGFEYDTVVGSSVGSINGALMVQGDYEIAESMWKTIKTDMVFGGRVMTLPYRIVFYMDMHDCTRLGVEYSPEDRK